MKEYLAGENEEGMRLSRFVQRVTRNFPDSMLHKSFRNKRIKVNGKRVAPEHRLQAGDRIALYINDEFFWESPAPHTARALPADALPEFSVEFENEDIAILYKPAGVLCHPEKGGAPSLLDAFIHRQLQNGEYVPERENQFAPALCNRLDRGTEGLVVAAKRQAALRDMNALIREQGLKKTYLCVTVGTPAPGEHHAFLARNRSAHSVEVRPADFPGAKPIVTGVRVLETANGLALCEVDLITGRTHQIRAHLAFLGTPVLGDKKYGNPAWNRRAALPEQALCAWQLAFPEGLPPGHTLHGLAGRVFTARRAALPVWWENQKKGGAFRPQRPAEG